MTAFGVGRSPEQNSTPVYRLPLNTRRSLARRNASSKKAPMLKKHPRGFGFVKPFIGISGKKRIGKGIAFLAGIELTCFLGCYYAYRQLNHNQETRYWISENYPSVLEYYYQIGERLGNSTVREFDQITWATRRK